MAEIRPGRIRELIALMKTMSVLPRSSEAEGLEEYLTKGVKKVAGADLTTEELWNGYLAYFHGRRDVALLPHVASSGDQPPCACADCSARPGLTSIDRGGRAQRGYNDLCLVIQPNASPGNDNGNGAPMKQCPTPVAESTADARPKDRGGDIQMSKDANGVTDAKDAGDKHQKWGWLKPLSQIPPF